MFFFLCHNTSANRRGVRTNVQTVIVMTVLLLATFVAQVKAAQKVTLSFKNAKLEQVFSEISRQTDYRFFYSDEVTQKATPVSIDVKNVDVLDLLNELIQGQSMKYKVIAGTIIINVIKEPVKISPPPVLSQEIIVFADPADTAFTALEKKTGGLIKANKMEKPAIPLPSRALSNALVVEEPGGS